MPRASRPVQRPFQAMPRGRYVAAPLHEVRHGLPVALQGCEVDGLQAPVVPGMQVRAPRQQEPHAKGFAICGPSFTMVDPSFTMVLPSLPSFTSVPASFSPQMWPRMDVKRHLLSGSITGRCPDSAAHRNEAPDSFEGLLEPAIYATRAPKRVGK